MVWLGAEVRDFVEPGMGMWMGMWILVDQLGPRLFRGCQLPPLDHYLHLSAPPSAASQRPSPPASGSMRACEKRSYDCWQSRMLSTAGMRTHGRTAASRNRVVLEDDGETPPWIS